MLGRYSRENESGMAIPEEISFARGFRGKNRSIDNINHIWEPRTRNRSEFIHDQMVEQKEEQKEERNEKI